MEHGYIDVKPRIARHLLVPLLAVLLATMPFGDRNVHAQETGTTSETRSGTIRGVVELFTSQGCSSCVTAERVIAELAGRDGIVTLAYHVDYWDYIGWIDPHGTRANTDRQRAYAKAFGTGTIYTPQAVVNGVKDIVGSRRADIETALETTKLTGSSTPAKVVLVMRGDRLHISADATGARAESRQPVLMLVTYDDETRTLVDKGDNRGKTIVNTHAVRDWRILGMWDGKPMEIDLPLSTLRRDGSGKTGCAAILQTVTDKGTPGPILAAAALEF